MNTNTRRRVGVAGIPLVAMSLFSLSPLNPLRMGPAAATGSASATVMAAQVSAAAEQVALTALITQQTLGSDDSAINWKAQPAPAMSMAGVASGAPGSRMQAPPRPIPAAAEQAKFTAASHKRVDALFSGAAVLARMNFGIDNAAAGQADPDTRDLGGGVSSLAFTQAVVSEATASLTAEATMWASYAQKLPDGSWTVFQPESAMIVKMELVKSPDGRWTVDKMVESFASGSGP